MNPEYNYLLQQSFQLILATDGRTSFAIFRYSYPEGVKNIINIGSGAIGFDAGDKRRSVRVPILNNTNVFRIDGMYAFKFQG